MRPCFSKTPLFFLLTMCFVSLMATVSSSWKAFSPIRGKSTQHEACYETFTRIATSLSQGTMVFQQEDTWFAKRTLRSSDSRKRLYPLGESGECLWIGNLRAENRRSLNLGVVLFLGEAQSATHEIVENLSVSESVISICVAFLRRKQLILWSQ